MATINILHTGGSITVSANTTPAGPVIKTAVDSGSWITGTGTVTASTTALTVAANTATTVRSTTLHVSALTQSNPSYAGTAWAHSSYTVTQEAQPITYKVIVTGTGSTAGSAATSQSLTISANTSWTLTSSDISVANFAGSATKTGSGNGSATLTITKNTGSTVRNVTITVTPGAGTATPTSWTITQSAGGPVIVTGYIIASYNIDTANFGKPTITNYFNGYDSGDVYTPQAIASTFFTITPLDGGSVHAHDEWVTDDTVNIKITGYGTTIVAETQSTTFIIKIAVDKKSGLGPSDPNQYHYKVVVDKDYLMLPFASSPFSSLSLGGCSIYSETKTVASIAPDDYFSIQTNVSDSRSEIYVEAI